MVESSFSLEAWQPVPDTQLSATTTTETRQATVEASEPSIYFRIRVTTAP